MVDYTPTTEEVRGRASWGHTFGDEYDPDAAAEFDCWLDEHDRQVLASNSDAPAEVARLLAGIAKISKAVRADYYHLLYPGRKVPALVPVRLRETVDSLDALVATAGIMCEPRSIEQVLSEPRRQRQRWSRTLEILANE